MDDLEPIVKAVASENEAIISRVNELENCIVEANLRIQKLESDQNKKEQTAYTNNLIITGLAKMDNPAGTFWKLAEVIKAETKKEAVQSIQLVKAKMPTDTAKTPRFISDTLLVKLSSRQDKMHFIEQKKKMGGAFAEQAHAMAVQDSAKRPRVIFFRDHLTDFGMNLFAKANTLRHQLKYKFLWTKDGQILLRENERSRPIRISSEYDLQGQLKSAASSNTEETAPSPLKQKPP